MPKVTVTDKKGLVQSTGAGFVAETGITLGAPDGFRISGTTKTTGTIAVTKDVNTDVAFTQPAGTTLKDLVVINAGVLTNAGGASDDFNISMGAGASYVDLLAATALLDGASVTWLANVPLYVIKNSHGHAANAFKTGGIGPVGGPATSEAIVVAAALYSSSARTINVRFTPVTTDMAVAATTIKVIATFLYH